VEHFYIKFSYPNCSGFLDMAGKTDAQTYKRCGKPYPSDYRCRG